MTLEQAIDRYTNNAEYERIHGSLQGCLDFRQLAEWLKDYKRLLEQQPCDDVVSREMAINSLIDNTYLDGYDLAEALDAIENKEKLPSVTPKQKTGKWEWVQYDYNPKLGNWNCSECRSVVIECVGKEEKGGIPLYKYCPQCGAKMQESEDKE